MTQVLPSRPVFNWGARPSTAGQNPTTNFRVGTSVSPMVMAVTGGIFWILNMWNPVTHPHSCGTPCQDVHQRGNKPTPAPTPAPPDAPCLPASGTFSGISYTGWQRQSYPFETCFQLGDASTYCWTKSYFCTQKHWNSSRNYCFCAPDGDKWQPISAEYVNPVTHPNSCGSPCLEIHQAGNGHTR